MARSRMKSVIEFQTVRPATEKTNGRKCWAGKEVLQVVDGWQNADATECQHRRPERSSPTGMAVHSRSDTGELSLPTWKTPSRGHRVSGVCHAISNPGRDQTSEYQWWHAQQHSPHAITCLWYDLSNEDQRSTELHHWWSTKDSWVDSLASRPSSITNLLYSAPLANKSTSLHAMPGRSLANQLWAKTGC